MEKNIVEKELDNLLKFAEQHGKNIQNFLTELSEERKEVEMIKSCPSPTDGMVKRLAFLGEKFNEDSFSGDSSIVEKIKKINETSRMIDEKFEQLTGKSAKVDKIIGKVRANKNIIQYF